VCLLICSNLNSSSEKQVAIPKITFFTHKTLLCVLHSSLISFLFFWLSTCVSQCYQTCTIDNLAVHSRTTHTLQPIQSHPKKKGGFAITSVKDNVDGDESADDLDESHTSYSEMSYSRTTDVDHDQESSASEDTLNTTVQDGMQQLASSQTSVVVGLTSTGPDVSYFEV